MSSRFRGRQTFVNDEEMYENIHEGRGVKKINQYSTPKLPNLTPRQRSTVKTVSHVWKIGDRYYKLAQKYYGNPTYWWVIAQFNFAPTEAHLYNGAVLKIPVSLEEIMRYY